MNEGDVVEERVPHARNVGDRLREARVAQRVELTEIASRTRIPLRHLEAIETGDHSALPSVTYAMGFARAYARAVDLDDADVARQLRGELATTYQRREPTQDLEPIDSMRGPTPRVAIVGVLVAVALLVVIGLWYGTSLFRRDDPPAGTQSTAAGELGVLPSPQPTTAPVNGAPVAPVPAGGGQVTLTATDEVWVRIYDANNTTLLIKTLAPGERYDVPMTADRPMINVGRPDKLTVTLNGSALPPLGTGARAIKDVGIGAEALRARSAGDSAPAQTAPATGGTTPPAE